MSDEQKKRRFTFDIDEELYRQLRVLAAIRNRSMADLLRELVKREIEASPKPSAC